MGSALIRLREEMAAGWAAFHGARLISKAIRLTIALLLLALCVELIVSAAQPALLAGLFWIDSHESTNETTGELFAPARFPSSESRNGSAAEFWEAAISPDTPKIDRVTLTLDVTRDRLRAEYDVYLPADHPLTTSVATAPANPATEPAVAALLGTISGGDVGDREWLFEVAAIEYESSDQEAHIVFRTEPAPYPGIATILWSPPQIDLGRSTDAFEVYVNTHEAKVRSHVLVPILMTTSQVRYNLLAGPGGPVSFEVASMRLREDVEAAQRRPPAPRTAPTGFRWEPLLSQLPLFVPYLALFLLAARRDAGAPPVFQRCGAEIGPFVGVQFLYAVLTVLAQGQGQGRILSAPVVDLLKRLNWWPGSFADWVSSSESACLIILILGVIWPMAARGDAERNRQPARTERRAVWRLAGTALVILAIGAGVGGAIFQVAHPYWWAKGNPAAPMEGPATIQVMIAYLAPLLLLAAVALGWILAELGVKRALLARSIGLAALLLVLTVLVYYTITSISGSGLLWHKLLSLALFVGAGTALVQSTWTYLGALLWPDARVTRSARVGIAMAIGATLALAFHSQEGIAEIWNIWDLASIVFHASLFVLLFVLLASLREVSRQRAWPECGPFAIGAGLAAAVAFIYPTGNSWPAALAALLGYLMLRGFLLEDPERAAVRSTLRRRHAILGKLIELNEVEAALRKLRAGLMDKLSKGEVQWWTVESKVNPLENVARQAQAGLVIAGRNARFAVLRFGPRGSAWECGVRMAGWSLAFSLPWMAITFHDLLLGNLQSRDFLLFGTYAMGIPVQWGMYGFFFGYFFAYLRGPHGVWKSLAFFVSLAAPQVIATAVANPESRSTWKDIGFWLIEVFIVCGSLGLTADLITVVNARRPWRDMLAVHNLASLSAWGSAFALAIGAAATAVATNQIPNLINLAWRLAFQVPLPPPAVH